MAPVSTICSLILALMVALSGGGNIDEVPEMMDVLTLRNMALDIDFFGEEMNISLPMEFQLASAVGAHEGVLQFEIHDEDGNVLLPVSGRVVSDALQFAIGDSENAYGVYEQDILDEVMPPEEILELTAQLTEHISYAYENGLMNSEMNDVEASVRMLSVLADQKQVPAEETDVDIEGEMYPGKARSFSVTQDEIRALTEDPPEGLSEDEAAALEVYAMVAKYYEMLNDISAAAGEDMWIGFAETTQVELAECEIDGEEYIGAKLLYTVDDMQFDIEYRVMGDFVEQSQKNTVERTGEGLTERETMNILSGVKGPAYAPEGITMVMNMDSYLEYEDGYALETAGDMIVLGGVQDGLWTLNGSLAMTVSEGEVYEDGTEELFSVDVEMFFNYFETLEDDGSKTGYVELGLNYVDMLDLVLRFEVNMTEAPYADPFAGRELKWISEMTEEEQAVLEQEWAQAIEPAAAAFKAWSDEAGEALGLQTVQPAGEFIVHPDGSIEHVVYDNEAAGLRANNSLRQSIRGKVFDGEAEYAEEYDYSDVYEEYDGEYEEEYEAEYVIPEYYSWAEAQAVFSTEIPDYTAPEKWPLKKIEMFHDDYMYAYFGDYDDGFAIDISDYGNTGVERYTIQDGAMVPFEEFVIDCYSEDGNVYWANFNYGSCVVGIYFNATATYADLETVLAGFEF